MEMLKNKGRNTQMKAVIHWKINGATGHGSVIDLELAKIWVASMNEKYGAGTHWTEECK